LREFWAWHFNNEGLIAEKAGKISQAEKYFQRASDLDPGNPWIPNNLALVLEGAGRKDEAKTAFQKSILVDSNFIEPYLNLGALYLKESKWREALVPLAQGYAVQPKEERILYNLASAHYGLGEYQKSLSFIEKAIKVNSNSADSYLLRADVFSKLNRNQEAQKDRKEAFRLKGNASEE
jgi:tetratricopeptide (TPR) repeat protein